MTPIILATLKYLPLADVGGGSGMQEYYRMQAIKTLLLWGLCGLLAVVGLIVLFIFLHKKRNKDKEDKQ